MKINPSIQQLGDQTVLDILSYLTDELKEQVPDLNRGSIKSSQEANAAIIEFMQDNHVHVDAEVDDPVIKPEQSRELLQMLWNDEDVKPKVEELVNHPPAGSQRSAETAITAAIMLGSLITWLQTKVDIQISRKDGKTSFKFRLLKEKSSEQLIKEVVNPISSILTNKITKDKSK